MNSILQFEVDRGRRRTREEQQLGTEQRSEETPTQRFAPVVFSFDIEEHNRIEAAAGYDCPAMLKAEYARRMEVTTRKLLDVLAEFETPATFFIVGQIAQTHPKLVRDIAAAGHEIACHSWDHRRVHRFNPDSFRDDVLKCKTALEYAAGVRVTGYRAPTFSIVRETLWALDVLQDCGFTYDSSIFPVRHDRYGIPDAPRTPFRTGNLVELPPLTLRRFGINLPVAGGGYFRLFPLSFMKAGIRQNALMNPAGAVLYFHPWEFDIDQPRLPLGRFSRWRTYVGIGRSFSRLRNLLATYRGMRADQLASLISSRQGEAKPIHARLAL